MDSASLLAQFEPKPTGVTIDHPCQLWQARYSPCGQRLFAGGYDGSLQRWDVTVSPPQRLPEVLGHRGWLQCLEFAPAGGLLFTADSWGRLSAWRYLAETLEPVWTHESAHDGWIRAVAVSADGTLVATGGNDGQIRLWSAADGTRRHELAAGGKVFSLTFHPREPALVSGDLQGKIRQWSVPAGELQRELAVPMLSRRDNNQECGGARCLAFDAEGRVLVCAGQQTPGGGFAVGTPCTVLFDWGTGKQTQELAVGTKEDGFAYDARFHPAGFVMATSCAFPGKGHVWFWKPGEPQAFYVGNSLPNGRSLSLHPDGRQLALLVSVSPNANGRQLENGTYPSGAARIHILRFAEGS